MRTVPYDDSAIVYDSALVSTERLARFSTGDSSSGTVWTKGWHRHSNPATVPLQSDESLGSVTLAVSDSQTVREFRRSRRAKMSPVPVGRRRCSTETTNLISIYDNRSRAF